MRLISLLVRKTVRDFAQLIAPAAILSLVIAAGLSSFIMSRNALMSLHESKRETYKNLNFADLSVPLVRAPRSMIAKLQALPGVHRATCRISKDGQVLLAQAGQNIQARFHSLSLPLDHNLNAIRIVKGRLPNERSEAVVSEAFAHAWQIKVGDKLEVVLNGKKLKLRVSGLARSPEYVFQAGSAGEVPDDRLFSVWWTQRALLEGLLSLRSSCNELLLELSPSVQMRELEQRLKPTLSRFGYTHMIPRARQLSNYFVESELSQLRAMAFVLPAIFLSITLFLLHITLARLLLTQRENIGTLLAFGLPRAVVFSQTFLLACFCLMPGIGLGLIAGGWLSIEMFELYAEYYRFAFSEERNDTQATLLGVGFCFVVGFAGAANALRNMIRSEPASLLRAQAPAHTRASHFDSLKILQWFGFTLRMSFRNILRRPLQTVITLVGLSLSLALLVFAGFERSAINRMISDEFILRRKETHTLLFAKRLPRAAMQSIRQQLPPGTLEGRLTLPVLLKRGLLEREITLEVIPFARPLSGQKRGSTHPMELPGLSLSRALSAPLGLNEGEVIELITRDAFPQGRRLTLSRLEENTLGYVAHISAQEFSRHWLNGSAINTIAFRSRGDSSPNKQKLLNRFPTLAALLEKDFALHSFKKTMEKSIGVVENFMIGFALLIALGVLFNNARVQFAERQSELALLRAIGLTQRELNVIFWSDHFLLLLFSIPPGLLLGRQIVRELVRNLETEMFRIPSTLENSIYIEACLFLLAGVLLAMAFIQPQLRRLPYLAVLKTRE